MHHRGKNHCYAAYIFRNSIESECLQITTEQENAVQLLQNLTVIFNRDASFEDDVAVTLPFIDSFCEIRHVATQSRC